MTPEELNRTIEFILQSLARVTGAQEQNQESLKRHQETLARLDSVHQEERRSRQEFEAWSKDMASRVVHLLDLQSQRLDRQDKFYRDFMARTETFQDRALHLLNLLLDRLPPAAGA